VGRIEILAPGSGHRRRRASMSRRLVKFLLWRGGGWKIVIGGPRKSENSSRQTYSPRALGVDVKLMEAGI